ncbi:hypothetical protein [Mucilaginibacter sp. OK098]|uniref:DUF7935 family protein n=1 Tax=Mucilaginibacter sp. OK098 TaxID=1855297 RepID=UPI00091431AA|nr:hypothetical protein [Mucilaginibacter sp. OK098]SHN24839.1 hypothetical protein SAMN05216524_107210 [Mucilaginibacter sp. OK098]
MNFLPYFLDIVKYTIAGLGIVWIAFYLIKPYLDRDEKIQLLEFRKTISNQTLPLRLQAYERCVLFIERVNPANMLIRLNAPSYSAHELYSLIVDEIRNEYQHNITQQIYLSSRAWGVVKHVKEDTLGIVNNAIKGAPETATGLDLSKIILGSLSQLEDNPYELGASMLRKDLEELF